MIPEYRRGPRPEDDGRPWKEASVLVLLYPADGRVVFPLIQRTSGTGVHAGQVSLPGGSREPGESAEECALRETSEELGFDVSDIRILRELTPLRVPPSRFLVRPFSGTLDARPVLRPSPAEVEECFETGLDDLLFPGSREEDLVERDGRLWRVPFYRLSGRRVWGATAMILAELAAVVGGR
jgi:8-oxo-dGTP pyrophosphatase MutT (NUDIX family)